jgi:hypothetical protein
MVLRWFILNKCVVNLESLDLLGLILNKLMDRFLLMNVDDNLQ